MLVGSNFEKMQIDLFGLHILEPNAIVSNLVMGIVSFILAYKLREYKNEGSFTLLWYYFFLVYGLSSIVGAIGHGFFLYLGVPGKTPTWIAVPFAVFLIEIALVSLYHNKVRLSQFKKILYIKLVLIACSVVMVCLFLPVKKTPELAFLPIAINTIIGLISTTGILGYTYSRSRHKGYKHFLYGVIVMIPSAFFFLGKININPWLDKNDVSHYLLTIGIVFFYFGVTKTLSDHTSKHTFIQN